MKKITRIQLDRHIKEYATDALTLEIGSYGNSDYKKYFPNRVGIDIRTGPGVDQIANVYNMPFEDNSFECVLCISVLEHTEHPESALMEIQRVLKPNGMAIFLLPFLFPLHDAPGDYWRFTRYGIEVLFKNWGTTTIKPDTEPQIALAALLQRYAYQNQFYLNALVQIVLKMITLMLFHSPSIIKKTWGDGSKKIIANDAFALDYLVICKKPSKI